MQINAVYVIVKLVERCNLNCSYCYYYAPNNQDVYERPSLSTPDQLRSLISYMKEAVVAQGLKRVVFGLHGGEPTLAKAASVREFCELAVEELGTLTSVGFTLQTNAVHLSPDWLALIADYRMGIGVSIDGDKAAHDKYRVDHRGRGSYDRVTSNLAKLLELDRVNKCRLTVLAVMSDEFNGVEHYRHITETLGVRRVKPLFVDRTQQEPLTESESDNLGEKLCGLFDYWLENHSRTVEVTLFNTIVKELLANKHNLRGSRDRITLGFAFLSDGRVRIQDDFIITDSWYATQHELYTNGSTFSQYVDQPHLQQLIKGLSAPPAACAECEFSNVCAGGEVAHRYSHANTFDDVSVYCRPLYMLHRHAKTRLEAGEKELQARQLAVGTR